MEWTKGHCMTRSKGHHTLVDGCGCLVFSVGITGHRDWDERYASEIRACLKSQFGKLRGLFTAMPMEIVTGLAEGADTIATEVALELGLPVRSVLPMPRSLYEEDFSGGALDRFRELANDPRIQVDEIQLPPGMSEENARNRAVRDKLYARLKNYFVRRSNVLIALWDGEVNGLEGGSSDVVISYLSGSTKIGPTSETLRLQDDAEIADESGDVVIWIKTPRISESNSIQMINVSYLLSAGASRLIVQRNDIPAAITDRWSGLQKYAIERISSAGANVPAYPLSIQDDLKIAPLSLAIDQEFVHADQLAMSNQKKSDFLFKMFGMMAGTMGLLFLIYAKIAELTIFLAGYVLIFALGFLMFALISKRGWFGRHLAYRALAETLRTRFFLVISGAGERVNTNRILAFTSILLFRGFEWLRDAIRCSEPLAYESDVPMSVRLEVTRKRWFSEQSEYFERKLHDLHVQHERLEKVKKLLFVTSFGGALALLFFGKSIAYFHMGNLDGKTVVVFLMALLPLWLAIWELYQNKKATRELLWQYSNRREFFHLANTRFTCADNDSAKIEITADLAERSMIEIFQWASHRFHREHEPPTAG